MTKGNKRGFIPPQPAAALSALDFAAANEAFTRAAALALKAGPEDEAVDAAADIAAELADKLLGIPTNDPAQIGQKIAAYHFLHQGWPGLLTDPALRQEIAKHGDDPSQGLLAIYLDVTQGAPACEPIDALAAETVTVLQMERQMLTSKDAAEAEAWDNRCLAAIKAADALAPAPENLASKIRGLRLIYENNGGFDEMDAETADCRLLRDIAETLLAMGIGA